MVLVVEVRLEFMYGKTMHEETPTQKQGHNIAIALIQKDIEYIPALI